MLFCVGILIGGCISSCFASLTVNRPDWVKDCIAREGQLRKQIQDKWAADDVADAATRKERLEREVVVEQEEN